MDSEKETVVFVEFNALEGTPCQVMTHEPHQWGISEHDYDFCFSKKWGLLFHYTGFGPASRTIELTDGFIVNAAGEQTPVETVYWAAPGVAVKESPRARRLEVLPDTYTQSALFDPYRVIECTGGIVWCSVCEDCMPDVPWDYCEHVWWCHICDEVSTPDERCGHEAGAEEEE